MPEQYFSIPVCLAAGIKREGLMEENKDK